LSFSEAEAKGLSFLEAGQKRVELSRNKAKNPLKCLGFCGILAYYDF
jgi:hypothetical protein